MAFLLLLLSLSFAADWLSTKGNKIVDTEGDEVWLTGLNWFGYNIGQANLDGLYTSSFEDSIQAVADHGFNILRLPFSTQLLYQWSQGEYPEANFHKGINVAMLDKTSLEIWDYVLERCRLVGIKVFIDIHSAKTDSSGHMFPLWYTGEWTTERAIGALKWIADRHKDDDTILAYDIKNEPHGAPDDQEGFAKWDKSKDANNYKYFCEQAANAIHSVNPNVLVLVEGIEVYPKDINANANFASKNRSDYLWAWWGANLRGVKDSPINITTPNKLVYSPHDYGPAVSEQPWLKGSYTYQSVMDDYWYDSWFYIHDKNIAPLLIGEWGGRIEAATTKWMDLLLKLMIDNHVHHTHWCYNPNSGDTGGMVDYDWKTWDEKRWNYIKGALWQQGGKFISLYHDVKLGADGLSLNDLKKLKREGKGKVKA